MAKAVICTFCGKFGHYQTFCRSKPNKAIKQASTPIRKESVKSRGRRIETANKWFKKNPPDEDGHWICYLQISSLCPVKLDRGMLSLEHVEPKVKRPDLKYNTDNIRPSCSFCNKMKGSRTLEQLARIWPHLIKYLV